MSQKRYLEVFFKLSQAAAETRREIEEGLVAPKRQVDDIIVTPSAAPVNSKKHTPKSLKVAVLAGEYRCEIEGKPMMSL